MKGRETIALINLKNLIHNLNIIKKAASKCEVLCVVKANAYGHGIIAVSKALERNGVKWFGVAISEEGIILRKNGIKGKILILNGIFKQEAEEVIRYSLTPTVFDESQIIELERVCKKFQTKVKVHLKVDTGMGRLGVMPRDFNKLLNRIMSSKYIQLEGVFSHFAHADFKDIEFIKHQLGIFDKLTRKLNVIKHIANSAGTFLLPESHLDMVRVGISLYGVPPSFKIKKVLKLKPVMSLKTKIHSLKELPKGHGVSYGHTYRMRKKGKVGIIPIGYGDGFMRMNSNRGYVLIRGERCPVVGTVCMDLTIIDVSHLKHVSPGDEVILIGRQGENEITAYDIAENTDTIPYEVLCAISQRVKREYLT